MNLHIWSQRLLLCLAFIGACFTSFANENLFKQARTLQREGKADEAVEAYKHYLALPVNDEDFDEQEMRRQTEALMQLMNTYQSKGEPEACIIALEKVFKASSVLQHQCLRDYYSIMGYALSRTEHMEEAEATILKALTLPLLYPTPERYFRDNAYAAAVFYSNPKYQKEVINWCEEALRQAELCENTSGKQWVTAMLGSLYKRNGHLNKALELFEQSRAEARLKKDDLAMLNSLHALIDFLLYWETPELADVYASEALRIEKVLRTSNPMVSAQTYLNKGKVMHQLGNTDSVAVYASRARQICQSLPYNSGMVDVNLLHGTYLTQQGGDSLELGIEELMQVVQQATPLNRAKAYHQLALTYLERNQTSKAETMLDSMYVLLHPDDAPTYIRIDFHAILNHYLKTKNQKKVAQYTRLLLKERQALKEKQLSFNIIQSIVDLQTEQKQQELTLVQLRQTNQLLLLLCSLALATIIIAVVLVFFMKQRRKHDQQMKQADAKLTTLVTQLQQSNAERDIRAQELRNILDVKDQRQELETLTPSLLQTSGETKFRQCFELLHPLFLPRLHEKVPTITRREELLSMLIVLQQDNKRIAELLAIAPRSVLMLRHRFRQKLGIHSERTLENFIEEVQND